VVRDRRRAGRLEHHHRPAAPRAGDDPPSPARHGRIDSIRPPADAKGITLHLELDDTADVVYGDRERLQQVLWNLLSNGVKFTPQGGQVTVRVVRADNGVEVTVSDTGAGLSADFLPFAFDRFRQADQSFTRAHGGLGLGLAIVKQIVELHGGRVEAESAGLGHGATFRVFLPLEPAPSASTDAQPLPANALPEIDLTGRSILVVDDDAFTRELLTDLLTQCHARVQTADSAVAAIARVEQTPPALIIADIGMPGQDGLTMMATIRQLPADRGGALPAIALSAYARAEDRAAALGAGFTDFLTKPARPEEVLRAVQLLLD
jgi:CheY-like chemotaxis protein